MNVHDAQPGDIYVDESGNLWRVSGVYQEPTVGMECVEPSGYAAPPLDTIDIETGQPPQG